MRPRPETPRARRRHHTAATSRRQVELVLQDGEASLLDLVDNTLNKGVVLTGDLTIALAQVDLVYARLSLLLCAADRVLPAEDPDLPSRHRARRALRAGRRGRGLVGPRRGLSPASR